MKLSKAIIKKYGISKKAWSVARHSKNKKVNTMARRRFRRSARRSGRRFGGGSMLSGLMPILGGAVYGMARPYLNQAAQPLLAKMPFGNYNNEILFGGGATLVKALVKNPTIRAVMTPIQIVEAASAGETILASATGGNSASAQTGVTLFY